MIQEGVTFSLGLLTPGGDAQWIASLGIPIPVILGAGILSVLMGAGTMALILPVAGIRPKVPFWTRFFILLVSMCSLMLIRFFVSGLADPGSGLENLVPLILSLLLAVLVAGLQRPVAGITGRLTPPEPGALTWSTAVLALGLGISLIFVQALALN